MKEIPVSEVRAAFAEMINRVSFGKERLVVTRHDRPLAVLVPFEDLQRLEEAEARTSREPKIPSEVYDRIRREAYEQAHRDIARQVREEAKRKLEAMMGARRR